MTNQIPLHIWQEELEKLRRDNSDSCYKRLYIEQPMVEDNVKEEKEDTGSSVIVIDI